MHIDIKYEMHAFAREQLCDEVFEYGDCIMGKEIIEKLNAKNNCIFCFEYSEKTCLEDVINAMKQDIQLSDELLSVVPLYFSFLNNEKRYFVEEYSANFQSLLYKYLLNEETNTVVACILLSCDAGSVDSDQKLRYYLKSREKGKHHTPHVHVRDAGHNYEASISIETGEILSGSLPKKLARMAKERITSKKNYFLDCWNKQTDGLKVDINKELGLINY